MKASQEIPKILSDGSHRIITKIITSNMTYVYYYDTETNQEFKIWLFKDITGDN